MQLCCKLFVHKFDCKSKVGNLVDWCVYLGITQDMIDWGCLLIDINVCYRLSSLRYIIRYHVEICQTDCVGIFQRL